MIGTVKRYAYSYFPNEFFDLIFQNTIEGNSLDVELRLRKNGNVEQRFYRSKKQIENDWPRIEAYSREFGYDVDFTVVPRQRSHICDKEHKLPEPPILNCFWADLDVGEGKAFSSRKAALRRILKVGPEPNILVMSGRGLHPYYCLKGQKKIRAERAEALLKKLAEKLHVDPGAARVKRLMRVPHTINHKYGKLVRFSIVNLKRYRLKTLKRYWGGAETTKRGPDQQGAKFKSSQAVDYRDFFARHVGRFVRNESSNEGTGLCPFHNDHHSSFAVNVKTELWMCRATGCGAKGNIKQFCQRLNIAVPEAPPKSKDSYDCVSFLKSWNGQLRKSS